MADKTVYKYVDTLTNTGIPVKFKDMGDGTFAEVVKVTALANGGGSVTIDTSGNVTATVRAGSATAWLVQDTLLNPYWQTDTRVGVDGVSSHTIGNPNVGFAGAAGSKFHQIINSTFTLTLTGTTTVNALNGLGAAIQAPTITNASAGTVANASTFSISGAPTVTGLAVVTHNYAVDVVSGATHFGTATLGLGIDSDPGRVLNISGTLTGNPAAGQHGILMSLTSDGTFTGELVMMKVLITASTAAANTVGRVGAFNVGAVVLPSGDTIQKYAGFSIDGGSGLGAGVTVNTYYGADMGSLASPSVTITDGSGSGNPTGLFVGYRVGAWGITGSGTTTEYDGVLIKAPTFTTVGTAYGLKIESISGTTQGTSPTSFAINTAAGAVSHTVGTTVSSNGASLWDGLSVPASTLLLTGTTSVTGTNPGLNLVTIYQPTVSGGSAVSVTGTASTMTITGAPLQAGAGPATLQNVRILNIGTANTTIRNVGQSTYYAVGVAAHQLILSQATNNTNVNGINALTLDQITINQTGGAVTVQQAATLNIVGPPIAGASVTLTNGWAIRSQAGQVSLTGSDLAAATTPVLFLAATNTMTGAVTDAFTSALRLTPVLAGAFTATRLNYIDVNNVTGAGTVTDGCVFRFDANAGTHKAVDAGTTKTTPGAVTQWIKANINGTIGYIPSYSSKTT